MHADCKAKKKRYGGLKEVKGEQLTKTWNFFVRL